MRLSAVAWAEVRRLYEAGAEAVTDLAARHGVKSRTIEDRARREGWAKPVKPARPARHVASPARSRSSRPRSRKGPPRHLAAAPTPPSRDEQQALLARLYRAITWKLEDMEARMTSGDERSSQDEEREARALGNLISNFEKVTDVVLEFDKSSRRAHDGGRDAKTPDADEMRREIAERLERLNRGRNARHDPREP